MGSFSADFAIMCIYSIFILSLLFLALEWRNRKTDMLLWGFSWLLYSCAFLCDYAGGRLYITMRQVFVLTASWLFFRGACLFFQKRPPRFLSYLTVLFYAAAFTGAASGILSELLLIPSLLYSSCLIIISGLMFLLYSWKRNFPEKILAGYLLLVWSILMNYTGFIPANHSIAVFIYSAGIFTLTALILVLILTAARKTEILTANRNESFRTLVENSSDSMFLYDYAKERFQYASPNIVRLLGIQANDLYAAPRVFCRYIEGSDSKAEIAAIFEHRILHSGRIEFKVCPFDHTNPPPQYILVMLYLPIRDDTGAVIYVEGILRDVTEHRRMEAQLRRSEEQKEEFLENISHEIKTPVTLLMGYAETLLSQTASPDIQKKYLEMLYSKAQMLSILADDFTQVMSQVPARPEYRFYEYNAGELFSPLLDQCRDQAVRSDLEFSCIKDWDPTCILVADFFRIQQAVSNIMNNAVRHTPSGSTVTVSLYTRFDSADKGEPAHGLTGELEFLISDQGSGIPKEDLSLIFDRYYSHGTDVSNTAHGQARSGLGLHICQEIITAHQGIVQARNNETGRGACIGFILPCLTK